MLKNSYNIFQYYAIIYTLIYFMYYYRYYITYILFIFETFLNTNKMQENIQKKCHNFPRNVHKTFSRYKKS